MNSEAHNINSFILDSFTKKFIAINEMMKTNRTTTTTIHVIRCRYTETGLYFRSWGDNDERTDF